MNDDWQPDLEEVERFEERLVPAIHAPWAPLLVDAAGVRLAQHVLDVGCRTGIVARAAGKRVGRLGKVTGLDPSESMLAVARRHAPRAAWHRGSAADMPFADGVFDVVLCQAALASLPDRAGALGEMRRVAHSRGVVGVQVFGESPGHQAAAEALEEVAGPEEAAAFRARFALSDADELVALLAGAGLDPGEVETHERPGRHPSLEDFASCELEGCGLGGRVEGEAFLEAVGDRLEAFLDEDGGLELPMEGHIAIARMGGEARS